MRLSIFQSTPASSCIQEKPVHCPPVLYDVFLPGRGGMLGRGAGNTGRTPFVWTRLPPNDLHSALAALNQRAQASQEDGQKGTLE